MENIVSSFRAIAAGMPDEPALIVDGNTYTYRQLDQQSDRIATFLTNRHLQGKQVGAAMHRGYEWIASMLGIWKAGAAYVPLDLGHPRQRLESIIADCGIAFVICNDEFRPDNIPSCRTREMLTSEESLHRLPIPESTARAYIIYTSGTSGEPKGIPTRHHQAVRMSRIAKEQFFAVNPGDRMLQLAGLNFSSSLVETLTALLNGICLVMANDRERHDPQLLVELIERQQVCSAIIPPALLAVFPRVPLKGLRTLLVAGEGVATEVKDYWMKGRRMLNAYGFTENTVLVSCGAFTADTPVNDIGTLVPDSIAYVLDEELNPVPDGTPGELCIAGTQLTEGYWNRQELNERKFIRNPFLTDGDYKPNAYSRLFRSGDKVIRLTDGHFLYLGRLDNQVKIRGMRIELSEVEQCLNRYPGVSQSVVVAKEHVGRKVLVAYLYADKEISREKIAAFIGKKLPDYMCPSYYLTLLNFPMTINRKIDRKQLPDPQWDTKECKEQPATATENGIARLWQKQLGISVVGRYDNFISLGGDSISVLLMAQALEEAFGIRLKAEDIFSRLDLHILAQFIEQSLARQAEDIGRIIHKDVYDSCPLPPALRNLWSQCVSSDEMNEAYKLAIFLPWSCELNVELLQSAWNRIVQEQEALRMTFPIGVDGVPRIKVASFVYADIPVVDVKEENQLWQKARELYLPPFHPAEGPLHRVCLYRLPGGAYTLVLIIHHLVTDGWSLRVLDEKLRNYYQCAMQGVDFPVEDYTYRDYAAWQCDQLDKETTEQRRAFWKQYLSGYLPLHLNGKAHGEVPAKGQGSAKYLPLDSQLAEKLETYCRLHEITPFVACLSVFQLVLMKYTGQTDFTVGVAVTDRKRIEFQHLLGYFVSLLPVRTGKLPAETGKEKVRGFALYSEELMSTLIKLQSNSLPFDQILDSMESVRFAFGLEESPSGIHVPEEWVTASPLDMLLIMHKRAGSYSLHFQYATSCFDEPFILQFSDSFRTALRFLLDEPSRDMLACPLLPEDRIAERLSSLTFSTTSLPRWNIIDRFKQIATGRPELEAYHWSDFRMSYGQLDRMSDLLAIVLQGKFARMDKERKAASVGIFLKDKKFLLPAIVGVLKCGCCYVPLDVALPIERLLFIIGDADISVLLVDESYTGNLPCETFTVSASMETAPSMEKLSPVTFYSDPPEPEAPAYIIYTSGSTGKPKGVPISHHSLASFADSQMELYSLRPGRHVLQYINAGFDPSVMEIFPALATGASLVIPTEKERKDMDSLLALIEREKVYIAILPAALLPVLPYRTLPDLEIIVVGGETTSLDVLARWMHGRRLFNSYGPTENTVATTCLELSDGFLPNDIGTPLSGVSCYVLDDHLTLLPDYIPGELYIGGLQLTAGYLNRDELNREKFVDNPFVSPEDRKAGINTRLYKSGDKAMRTPEGHFIFLGRIDSQVKLHGFRIEPEEIAKRLEEYPGIKQAVVLLKEWRNEKRLVAYLLAEATGAVNETVQLTHIRKYLTDRLPSYMIPSAWAILDHFPLTVNGKIDRNALPEPELLTTEDYEPPVTPEEVELAKIAARLLELPRIGVCTDLFTMGLSSLQVMELLHDAKEKQIPLSVTDIYKGKNIRTILAHREKSLFFWANDRDTSKPLIILICGYPSFRPLYGRVVDRLKEHYSFFVFESFLEYYRNKNQSDAKELTDHYHNVLETALKGREIYAVMGYCLGSELAMLLAERLRTGGHPTIKALIIDGYIRRDKTLLVPPSTDNQRLSDEGRIANGIIETLPELSFGGEMIVCLAGKASNHFMFETDAEHDRELIRKMWIATQKNRTEWNDLYPQTLCYILDADHFSIFDDEPLSAICEIVKRNWIINE